MPRMERLSKSIENYPFPSSSRRVENTKFGYRNKHFIPEEYKGVASAMEKQFVKHMIDNMDKTISRSKEESSAEEYYKSLLYDEFANKISQNDTMGLQDIILDQVYPRRLRNELAYKSFLESKKNRDDHVGIKKNNRFQDVEIKQDLDRESEIGNE